ncbi:MAG: hypothetical protein CMF41_06730 [Legionellales bacterium]|nr:hypothetical protein [Legionellales bacterium]|tara:strand:+ start:2015 stop:2944 length:930 start_codon:yes stop_codon:yes gene_type:complete
MIFPYLSLYVLVFSFISFVLFILFPVPHGKFSWKLPLMIDSDIAWALINGPALIIIFGYFDNENGTWVSKLPSSAKGSLAMVFFIIHFIWRSIISVLWIRHIHSELPETRGCKKTSFLIVLVSWFYYPVIGMLIRHMAVNMTGELSAHDIIFLLGALIFLFLNAYVDIILNYSRTTSPDVKTHPTIGIYLTKIGLKKHFKILVHLGIECPNYFFEILEWGFFALFTLRFESLWWFVSTILILLPRALWTSHWYSECMDDIEESLQNDLNEEKVDKQPVNEAVKPSRVAPKKIISAKKPLKKIKLNGFVF